MTDLASLLGELVMEEREDSGGLLWADSSAKSTLV